MPVRLFCLRVRHHVWRLEAAAAPALVLMVALVAARSWGTGRRRPAGAPPA